MDKNEIDYKRAAEQLRKGEPLFGKDGALALMLERILNAALEGEMDAHLSIDERSKGNLHNGKLPKQVQTCYGEFTVETPRDRDGSFEPQTVKKRETILAEGMADQIINMYAFGTSTRDISKYFEREFDTKLSAETISSITDRVLPEIKSWRSRMLDPVYAICCIDGLIGFPDTIQSVLPDTSVQLCIVHQIRSSIKYVGSKHQKEFLRDLKTVYGAVSKETAETQLDTLESKWGEMYPIVIKSWRDNWKRRTEYFQYTPAIRKLIYTTNTVEGYHRQVRKATKNKGVFPSDTSPEKLVYLAYQNIRKKWTMPLANWSQISQQLAIKFGERFEIM